MSIKHLLAALAAAHFILPALAYSVPSISTTGFVSTASDSNLGLGQFSQDIVSDNHTELAISISHTTNINTKSRLILNLTTGSESYSQFDGLNNTSVDFKATYLFQFSNRFRSPQYSLHLLSGQSNYKSDLRDNTHTQFGLNINWRYDDRTLLRGGFSSETVDADSTNNGLYETFDNSRSSTYFGINITQTKRLSLYSSLSFISGDITANWTSATLDFYEQTFATIRPAWDTIDDTIFGTGRESTKYSASITKIALGFNYSFSQNNAFDILFESLDTGAVTYQYKIERLSLSYLQKF